MYFTSQMRFVWSDLCIVVCQVEGIVGRFLKRLLFFLTIWNDFSGQAVKICKKPIRQNEICNLIQKWLKVLLLCRSGAKSSPEMLASSEIGLTGFELLTFVFDFVACFTLFKATDGDAWTNPIKLNCKSDWKRTYKLSLTNMDNDN